MNDVAGDQDAVLLDENQFVALGVRRASPKEARGHAAEIEFRFTVEEHVRRAKFHILEQVQVLSRILTFS